MMGQIVKVSSPPLSYFPLLEKGTKQKKKKKKKNKQPTTMFEGVIIITKVLPKDVWMDGWYAHSNLIE